MPKPEDYKYTPDIKGYQSAVWDFLLEHSDITESGKIFIKFHTDSQRNFENRVLSRWKYNYHREDVQKKAEKVIIVKQKHKEESLQKKREYREKKKKRLAELREQQKTVPIKDFIKKVFK